MSSVNDNFTNSSLTINIQTTGLTLKKDSPYTDLSSWSYCRIVSIAWLYKKEGEINDYKYYIVKPLDFIIPENSSALFHSINQNHAIRNGIIIKKIFNDLLTYIKKANVINGYNIEWVLDTIKSEIYRISGNENELMYAINNIKKNCVMKQAKKFLSESKELINFIKMKDAYHMICNKEIYVLHNALYNVIIIDEILMKLNN